MLTLCSVPSAPRDVQVIPVGPTLISVSWFPPRPPNGILTGYTVLVLIEGSGVVFNRMNIPVSQDEQLGIRAVSIAGLDLTSVQYRVTVSARTSVGTGPESPPILIGTPTPVDATTSPPQTTPPQTTPPQTTPPQTMPIQTTPISTELESDTEFATEGTSDASTLAGTAVTTPTAQCGGVHIVICIVPPAVGGLLIVIIIILTMVFCCLYRALSKERKKGLYQFPGSDSDYR